MERLPRKLKRDSIVEALLEIRFSSDEVPELAIGKLSENPAWAAFPAQQMFAASLPAPIRHSDPNMTHLPLVERRSDDGSKIIRIGDRVLSVHRTKPYPIWPDFGPELRAAATFLFNAGLPKFRATRFGLRYINAFTEKDHEVRELNDLNLRIEIAQKQLTIPAMISYVNRREADLSITVRVMSRELVINPSPPDQTVLVDLDVASPEDYACDDVGRAHDWIERAHAFLKDEYFILFTEKMKKLLYEN